MLNPHPDLTPSVLIGLGWFYLLVFLMNLLWTIRSYKVDGEFKNGVPKAAVWAIYTSILMMVSFYHFTYPVEGFLISMPVAFRDFFDAWFSNPVFYFFLTIVGLVVLVQAREWWIKPTVSWVLLNLSIVFMGLSLSDYDFRQIVGKPDNVPIVAMLFIVAFFTWIYFTRSVDNDRRIAEGRPLFEQEDNEKVLVWPDLVYTELICMVVLTAVLIFWGIALKAPLEEPASSMKTPNPSKAPWYSSGFRRCWSTSTLGSPELFCRALFWAV